MRGHWVAICQSEQSAFDLSDSREHTSSEVSAATDELQNSEQWELRIYFHFPPLLSSNKNGCKCKFSKAATLLCLPPSPCLPSPPMRSIVITHPHGNHHHHHHWCCQSHQHDPLHSTQQCVSIHYQNPVITPKKKKKSGEMNSGREARQDHIRDKVCSGE